MPDPDPRGVVLHYTYDLRELAAHHRSPDYAERIGDTYIFNDEALLLRPDPLPRDAATPEPRIHVELRLPPTAQVATPWQKLPGPGLHFALSTAQFDGGSYVTIGTFEELGELKLPHTTHYHLPQVRNDSIKENQKLEFDLFRQAVADADYEDRNRPTSASRFSASL